MSHSAQKRGADKEGLVPGARPACGPRYFHLLWDEEVERLRGVLASLRVNSRDIMKAWHELYVLHFGEARTLSERQFADVYGHDLDRLAANLLAGDMEEFVADLRATGEHLVERGVPFREVIAVLHLFEESCSATLNLWREREADGPSKRNAAQGDVFLTFDKLSHCRLMVLAEAYFGATHARTVARARALEREMMRLSPDVRRRYHFHGIVGQSAVMREIFQRIQAAAASNGTVFIIGESGTGKELVARAIHELSGSDSLPFVPVNCSALPRELIESELFGYRRGAFSGAVTEYMGLFRAAEGGTIFLDEVTEMAAETQTKLLRVLQERSIRPVGSVREIPVNARIVASTNSDPQEAVSRGVLRGDLYYRLNVNTLYLPPMRERMEDLALLADYFLELFAEKLGCPKRRLSPEAMDVLQRYAWPGNVRELMNAIESAYTFGRGDTIHPSDLPTTITQKTGAALGSAAGAPPVSTFAETERELIARALEMTGGNKLRAAKLLGISRKKLYAKIAKYG